MIPRYCFSEGFRDAERDEVVALLRAYEAGIGQSLSFQGFAAEVAGLPGAYAPPGGTLILARRPQDLGLAGCVALRPVTGVAKLCEMKRLYVRPEARTHGLGRQLAQAAIAAGRRLGYERMCLDTLQGMERAQALYRSLGFRQLGRSAGEPQLLLFERDL
jgi:ribosomal protein S18 acetylase RimI-like enzyme